MEIEENVPPLGYEDYINNPLVHAELLKKVQELKSANISKLKTGPKGFRAVGVMKDEALSDVWKGPVPDDIRLYEEKDIVKTPRESFPVGPPLQETVLPNGLVYPTCGNVERRAGERRYLFDAYEQVTYDPAERLDRKNKVLRTAVHPAFTPKPGPQGYPMELNVPGQQQLASAVPVVVQHAHDENLFETQIGYIKPSDIDACKYLSPEGGLSQFELAKITLLKTFGDPKAEDEMAKKPFVEFGWKKNTRDGGLGGEYEGSFSIAGTTGEGQGRGVFQPAQQETKLKELRDAGEARRCELVMNLGYSTQRPYQALRSREEHTLSQFVATQNNVPRPGHIGNLNFSSIQVNSSHFTAERSAEATLESSLGPTQGTLHVDSNDEPSQHTMCVLCVKLPKGSDPGAFMLPELGRFVHDMEIIYEADGYVYAILYIMIRGKHAHAAVPPRMPDGEEGWRVMYVCYPTSTAFSRTGQMVKGPPVGCGDDTELVRMRQDFMQHGLIYFGSMANYTLYHVIENECYGTNYLRTAVGVKGLGGSTLSLKTRIESYWYYDELGHKRWCTMGDLLDPVEDSVQHDRLYSLALLHFQRCMFTLLGIGREEFKTFKMLLRKSLTLGAPPFDFAKLQKCDKDVSFIANARDYGFNQMAYLVQLEGEPGKWLWVNDSGWTSSNKDACKETYALARAGISAPSARVLQEAAAASSDMAMDVDNTDPQGEKEQEGGADKGKRKAKDQGRDASKRSRTGDSASGATDVPKPRNLRRGKRQQGGEDIQSQIQHFRIDVEHIDLKLSSTKWNYLLGQLDSQRSLFSAAPSRHTTVKDVSARLERYHALRSALSSTQDGSTTNALVALKLAVESARILPVLAKLEGEAYIMSAWVRMELNSVYVLLKNWHMQDAPRLASALYSPIVRLDGAEPLKTQIPWLDKLVSTVLDFARRVQGDSAGGAAEDIEVQLDEDTQQTLDDVSRALARLQVRLEEQDELESEDGIDAVPLRKSPSSSGHGVRAPVATPGGPPAPGDATMRGWAEDDARLAAEESRNYDGDYWPHRHGAPASGDIIAETLSLEIADTRATSKANSLRKVKVQLALKGVVPTPVALHKACSRILVGTLFELLLFPTVKLLLQSDGSSTQRKAGNWMKHAQQFLVERAAVLECLHKASGSRVIWALDDVDSGLLSAPYKLFKTEATSRSDFLFRSPAAVSALSGAFQSWFQANPDVVQTLRNLENLMQFHVQELQSKKITPRTLVPFQQGATSTVDPDVEPGPSRLRLRQRTPAIAARTSTSSPTTIAGTKAKGRKGAKTAPDGEKKKETAPDGEKKKKSLPLLKRFVQPADIVFSPKWKNSMLLPVSLLVISCLRRRGVQTGITKIDNYNSGLNRHGNPARLKTDQVNAVLCNWGMLQMMEDVLTVDEMKRRHGLSNLLAFHGSGQSTQTRTFFTQFWATSVPTNVNEAKRMVRRGLAAGHKVLNTCVWGQTSTCISWGTNNCNADAWFADSVMQSWEAWQAANPTPPSWKATMKWLTKTIDCVPFRSESLGAVHVVNRLAELGFCRPPTIIELAVWMATNTEKGAFQGLCDLGFAPCSVQDIILSLAMIHEGVQQHFTPEELRDMRYGPIVLENLLCKVHRFVDEVPKYDTTETETAYDWAEEALEALRASGSTHIAIAETLDVPAFRALAGKPEYQYCG